MSDLEIRCEAEILELGFKGCSAKLNEANTSAFLQGERKLKICSVCEMMLKRKMPWKVGAIERLIYKSKYQPRIRAKQKAR